MLQSSVFYLSSWNRS